MFPALAHIARVCATNSATKPQLLSTQRLLQQHPSWPAKLSLYLHDYRRHRAAASPPREILGALHHNFSAALECCPARNEVRSPRDPALLPCDIQLRRPKCLRSRQAPCLGKCGTFERWGIDFRVLAALRSL